MKKFKKRFPRGGKTQAKLVFNHTVKAIYHVKNYTDLEGEALRDACFDLAFQGSGERIVHDYEVNGQKPSNRTGVLLYSRFVAIFESAWLRAEETHDPYFIEKARAGGRNGHTKRPAIFSYKHLKGITHLSRPEQAAKLGCSDSTIGNLRRAYNALMYKLKCFFPELPTELLEEIAFAGKISNVAQTGKKATFLRGIWKVKRVKTNKYAKHVVTTDEMRERVDSYNVRTLREKGHILGLTHILDGAGNLVEFVRRTPPTIVL